MDNKKAVVILLILAIVFSAVSIVLQVGNDFSAPGAGTQGSNDSGGGSPVGGGSISIIIEEPGT